MKSISNETTFNEDTADRDLLDGHLWRLAEKVSDRAKAQGSGGPHGDAEAAGAPTSRCSPAAMRCASPTQMADRIYRTARELLASGRRAAGPSA